MPSDNSARFSDARERMRLTLNDGRTGEGMEGDLIYRVVGGSEAEDLTAVDIARAEFFRDGAWVDEREELEREKAREREAASQRGGAK